MLKKIKNILIILLILIMGVVIIIKFIKSDEEYLSSNSNNANQKGEIIYNNDINKYILYDRDGMEVKELEENDTMLDVYESNPNFNPDPTYN